MIKLYARSHAKEYIDDPHIDAVILRQTYQQIKSINKWTLGYWPTMNAVDHFIKRHGGRGVIKILDIGCGDGETLRKIESYAAKKDYALELTGIDVSPQVINAARQLSSSKINFINGDILVSNDEKIYDIIINSLTMHHLTDQEIIKLLQWMSGHVAIGWSISDLDRHAIAYYFIKFFAKLKGYNHIIRHDAPLSVARSFQRREWIELLTDAGLDLNSAKIFWYPNFRYGIRYEKYL